jgi:type III restriction enzyme
VFVAGQPFCLNSLLRSSAPPPSANQINRGPQLKQRVVRRFNPIQARNRIEDNLLLFVSMVGDCTRQRNGSQLHHLPLGWPMHCRVIHNIALLSNLNRDLELDRALRQPLIQLVKQIVRSLRRSRRSIQMLLPRLWNNRVSPIPAHAILIGELHRSKPKILLLSKARRKRCNRLHKCQRLGMTPHESLYLRWIALRHAPQKLQKLLPRSRRKSIDRVGHEPSNLHTASASMAALKIVKPFVLVIARDTTHAGELVRLIQSDGFFEGRYKEKVIQVDSSKTGAEEEEMISRLLKVEHADEPTEIVIHVNMLKEGWDVTNLYTIVPLRAANARILIEQSIGRGLRLPYGKRTGVSAVDRLSIVAHDRFQEIIDEANKPDSAIRLEKVIIEPPGQYHKLATVVSQSGILSQIGGLSLESSSPTITQSRTSAAPALFTTDAENTVARAAFKVISNYEQLPSSSQLLNKQVQEEIIARVKEEVSPVQGELAGVADQVDVAAVVAKTTKLVVQETIDIPRILVVPKGEVTSGFNSFTLDESSIHYQPVERDILIQHLRTHRQETLTASGNGQTELRLENYLVRALIDFDDISYDDHADLLYDLAGQMVKHLRSYLKDNGDVVNVLQYYQRQLADFIHSQMQAHHWEKAAGYDVVVSKGFTTLKPLAFTAPADEPIHDFRHRPADVTKIAQMIFGGFSRCLYPVQKFQSDTERVLSIILDREATKWFKPDRGQFQIFYKWGTDQREYQPDFVAETRDTIYMLEPKMRKDMEDQEIIHKKESAISWCKHASDHASKNGGKPWKYLLIPHDAIAENMTLIGAAAQFSVK